MAKKKRKRKEEATDMADMSPEELERFCFELGHECAYYEFCDDYCDFD